MIRDLNGSLPAKILNVANERTCFASCASTFKSTGLFTCLKRTSDKKLPIFLSRLNETNGGCEKILPVSGSFWSNLKFFRMMDFTTWL